MVSFCFIPLVRLGPFSPAWELSQRKTFGLMLVAPEYENGLHAEEEAETGGVGYFPLIKTLLNED
jgi:hypothetical protein